VVMSMQALIATPCNPNTEAGYDSGEKTHPKN
jgi:hypothetical protein